MTVAGVRLFLHLDVLLLCAGLVVGYWALVRRFGDLMAPRPSERAVTTWQAIRFHAGIVTLYLAAGAPLHDFADQALFSAHMVEHLLYALVIPPLLLTGVPTWMAEIVLRPARLRAAVRALSKPVAAALLFNGALLALHWPAVIDLMLRNELFHLAGHAALLGVAVLMWMNVFSPVPRIVPRLSKVGQMFYLFLMTLLPTVPASFLTFGTDPLYPAYATFQMPWGFDPVEDMRLAGLLMKTGGGFLLWGIIAVRYFQWASEEEQPRPADPAGPRPDVDLTPSTTEYEA